MQSHPTRVINVHAAMTVCSCCIPVAPSPPICNVVGKTEYTENIELTCRSEEGTPTPTYKWQSHNVNNIPRQLPLKATDRTCVCVCDAAQIHAESYGVKSMPHISPASLTSVCPSLLRKGGFVALQYFHRHIRLLHLHVRQRN